MTVVIVDVYPTKSSLESHRGILVNSALVLFDPLCPGEVIVRFQLHLSSEVTLVTVGEMELSDSPIEKALESQAYNSGWFKEIFGKYLKNSTSLKSVGM